MTLELQIGDLKGQIGELRGQVAALIASNAQQTSLIQSIDERLRNNENSTTKLGVKMSLIGIAAGGVGSVLVGLLQTLFTKLLE